MIVDKLDTCLNKHNPFKKFLVFLYWGEIMRQLEKDLRHSPLPARQLFGSIYVYFGHFLALMRHTVGILNLNEPLGCTPPFGLCEKGDPNNTTS